MFLWANQGLFPHWLQLKKTQVLTPISIPSGTAPGNYYVIGVADSGGVAVEKKENNNTEFSR